MLIVNIECQYWWYIKHHQLVSTRTQNKRTKHTNTVQHQKPYLFLRLLFPHGCFFVQKQQLIPYHRNFLVQCLNVSVFTNSVYTSTSMVQCIVIWRPIVCILTWMRSLLSSATCRCCCPAFVSSFNSAIVPPLSVHNTFIVWIDASKRAIAVAPVVLFAVALTNSFPCWCSACLVVVNCSKKIHRGFKVGWKIQKCSCEFMCEDYGWGSTNQNQRIHSTFGTLKRWTKKIRCFK